MNGRLNFVPIDPEINQKMMTWENIVRPIIIGNIFKNPELMV